MLYSMLRLITGHIRGFWLPLLAVIAIAGLLGAVATGVLALLAAVVLRGMTQRFDESVLLWLEAHRSPLLTEIMVEITTMGSGVPLILMVALAALLLWLTRHRWSFALLVLGSIGGTTLNRILKIAFDRPRPVGVDAVQQVTSLSFPSGHATSSFIVYGTLAYILSRLAPNRSVRTTIWGFAIGMILLVGFSRMYLGVHYPTDVLGGFLAGLAWVAVLATVMRALRFLTSRRPETHAEERHLHEPGTPHADRDA